MRKFILQLVAVALVALGFSFGTSSTASATRDHKVWVCKYVGKPHVDERLKAGKNPIEVDWHAIPGATSYDDVNVGDKFADAQDHSIVVQKGGENPGVGICPTPEGPPPTTTTTPAPTTTVPVVTTTTAPDTTTTVPEEESTTTTAPTTTTEAPEVTTTVPVTTTTAPPTTVVSTTTAPSTTVPVTTTTAVVLVTTTTAATTTTEPPTPVAPTTTQPLIVSVGTAPTPPPSTTPFVALPEPVLSAAQLPATGTSSLELLIASIALVLVGTGTVVAARRKITTN